MTTCTAPTTTRPSVLDPDGDPDFKHGWSCDWAGTEPAEGEVCTAEPPAGCSGPTTWPPLTSWERYVAERAAGERVPPSVSVWREQDRRRQAAAEREIREGATARPAGLVTWGPGPTCSG